MSEAKQKDPLNSFHDEVYFDPSGGPADGGASIASDGPLHGETEVKASPAPGSVAERGVFADRSGGDPVEQGKSSEPKRLSPASQKGPPWCHEQGTSSAAAGRSVRVAE